jgi:hypothetical protein
MAVVCVHLFLSSRIASIFFHYVTPYDKDEPFYRKNNRGYPARYQDQECQQHSTLIRCIPEPRRCGHPTLQQRIQQDKKNGRKDHVTHAQGSFVNLLIGGGSAQHETTAALDPVLLKQTQFELGDCMPLGK